MQLREALSLPAGLRYITDLLPLQSGVARRMLMETDWLHDAEQIADRYRLLETYIAAITPVEHDLDRRNLQFRLQGLKDICHTIERLQGKQVLDDIELFEVKHLALIYEEIQHLMNHLQLSLPETDLQPVVQILDPEGMHIASFYIYDAYSPELHTLRLQLERNPQDEQLFNRVQDEEQRIRTALSEQLHPYAGRLNEVFHCLVETDILLAKAVLTKQWRLCLPEVSRNGETVLQKMWNPEVAHALEERHRSYQPVSIALGNHPTILTGSNMGGKTIVLKTVGLCQLLFQYAFPIPAESARIPVRDAVCCSMTDNQSATEGLSSFAAEMQQLNFILHSAREGVNLLALIDEPARTTNPTEGTALVSALIGCIAPTRCCTLMVTHYTVDAQHCPCLRVRGLEEGHMNYELIEAREGEVPHEAVNIAAALGIDPQWLAQTKRYL